MEMKFRLWQPSYEAIDMHGGKIIAQRKIDVDGRPSIVE
jgi:hypothetical protein